MVEGGWRVDLSKLLEEVVPGRFRFISDMMFTMLIGLVGSISSSSMPGRSLLVLFQRGL